MRKREAQSLRSILDRTLQEMQIDGKLCETRLVASWPEIVGTGIASHTLRLYIKQRTLYVHLDSPVIRNELQMMRQSLMDHLNAKAGGSTIQEIVFR